MIEQSCSGSTLLACRGRIAFFDVVRDKENEAVGGFKTGAGIIDRDPRGAEKPGMQDVASLVDKAVLACGQQTDELALCVPAFSSKDLNHA
jgi:hypothetical protein